MNTKKLNKYKLRDLIEIKRGASLTGEYYSTEGELIRLTLGHFDYQNGGFKDNTSKEDIYFKGPVRSEFILKEGDIITPLTEQTPGLLGSTAIIPESGKYIQSQDIALVTPDESILDKDYCYYLLPSKIVKQQLAAGAQQTKIRHTTPDRIKDLTVFIPELKEQKAIGSLLKKIDKKIASNKEINRNLEALARQLYDYWFVQFDFPDENGRPYKSSGGKMAWNEKLKREIPDGWEVVDLGDYVSVEKGSTITKSEIKTGDIKVVSAATDYSFLHNIANREPYVITVSSSGANAGCINFWREPIFASDCSTIQGDTLEKTLYCYYWILHFQKFLYEQQIGAAQPHVYPAHIQIIPLIIPPRELLKELSKKIVPISKNQSNIDKNIADLINLRNMILPLLMNGQVSVKQTEVNCDLSLD